MRKPTYYVLNLTVPWANIWTVLSLEMITGNYKFQSNDCTILTSCAIKTKLFINHVELRFLVSKLTLVEFVNLGLGLVHQTYIYIWDTCA